MRTLGITEGSIGRSVGAGRLHRVFRGAFAVGHPAIGDRGRMLAAVLACGSGSVVSHRTAAFLLGLQDRPPALIEVIASRQSGREMDGIRCHHVPHPLGEETGQVDAIPCTSPSRTLVDLAGMLSEHSLRRTVERAATLRALDPPAIGRALNGSRRRGAPVLRRILSEWQAADAGGTLEHGATRKTAPGTPWKLRSDLEARLLALIGSAGLPAPVCNKKIEVDDEKIEVDFLWPERRLVVETDGKAFHDNLLAFERDRKRDRALQLNGYRVVRFTHAQIEGEPDAVILAIRRLLATDFG